MLGKKSVRISRINRVRSWNHGQNGRRSYRGHFSSLERSLSLSLHLSPSFTYLFFFSSLSPSFSCRCFFQSRIPPLFPPLPLAFPPTRSVLQLYRSGRGCSDPRRRSSESWVVATPYLLSRLASLLPRCSPSSGKLSTFFTDSRFYLPAAPRN